MINQNTIVALSTPPGSGAIGLIRISGSDAIKIASKCFVPSNNVLISKQESHKSSLGWIKDGDRIIDKVVATVFISPNSYTGENVVEFSCHGSSYILQEVIQLIIKKGAIAAQPGEFTLRSFLNGKMDLIQAEAVADLISTKSKAAHELAINQIRGGYSKDIGELRDKLIHFASLIALELDFSEEDVEFANRKEFMKLLDDLQFKLKELSESFAYGRVIKDGVPVAILGKPNSGKSSLLNALVKEEKAIVSDIEGTTRDSIEDYLVLDGIQFRFIDTAGLRDTKDKIESIGVKRALDNAKKAEILLYLYDVTDKDHKGIIDQIDSIISLKKTILLIQNKMDLSSGKENIAKTISKKFPNLPPALLLITHENKTINALKKQLVKIVEKIGNNSETIVTNTRHHTSLESALKDITLVKKGINDNLSNDLLSVDLNSAIQSLGEITGEINTDDILGNIFKNFCIGK
ncbi:MAG: tRNA uridine-5-carboxymethylaminomethyl(34) synthesis GTPase MnmE [Flavobacteriaceae bacterium]|nr:tRNA uridine-5-carboxymethylaminomethyl(34) synthesis GTPase MnmE [Flavobacteriaceae bacterium]